MRGNDRQASSRGADRATIGASGIEAPARVHASRATTRSSDVSGLASLWRDIEREASPNPFVTFAWVDAWWRALGRNHEPYVVLVEDHDGRALGLAPLMRCVTQTRLGGRVASLRFMGDPGSDRLGFVSRAGHEREVADAVAAWLRRQRHDWHVLALANLVEGCAELIALTRCFGGAHLVIDQPGLPCPFLTIESDWADYLQVRSANFRSELRRSRRKVEEDIGGRFRICSEPEDVRSALGFLFRHSIERLEDGPGSSFGDPDFRAFHLDAAQRLLECGRLSLWVLEIEETTAAVLYDLVAGEKVWFYNAAFDARWGAFKPGAVLLARAIEDAFDRGAREFDFLLGDYPYKRRWTAAARRHRILTVVRPRPMAVVEAAVPLWWDGAKEWVKRTAPPGVTAALGRVLRLATGGTPRRKTRPRS